MGHVLWTNQLLGKLKPDNWLIFGLKMILRVSRRDDFGSIFQLASFEMKSVYKALCVNVKEKGIFRQPECKNLLI